jgi:hypothetical protein
VSKRGLDSLRSWGLKILHGTFICLFVCLWDQSLNSGLGLT